jgi:hypothetical protein
MFEACLTLPRDRREATLIADNLDALARALREWPISAWRTVVDAPSEARGGLFERLLARTAPLALEPQQRARALRSAEAVADVLRVLWPTPTQLAMIREGADTEAPLNLVGEPGFEPGTSSSRTTRATELRYSPSMNFVTQMDGSRRRT